MDFNLSESLENGLSVFLEWLPLLLGAVVILLIGYIIARVLEVLTTRALQGLAFDTSLQRAPGGNLVARAMASPSHFVGDVVFWVIFVGAISLAATNLGVPALTEFIGAIYSYLPNVVAAILIFLVASAISAGVSGMVSRVMGDTPTGKLIATVVPALTMVIALFMILNQLRIAPAIVNITYTAIMGSLALGLALAFGLGGRDVAARMLEQAYVAGQNKVDQVKRDLAVGKTRGKTVARKAASKVRR